MTIARTVSAVLPYRACYRSIQRTGRVSVAAWALIELRRLSACEKSGTILFAALHRQFLQYVVDLKNNLLQLFQVGRRFFTRKDRGGDFAA